MARPAAIRAAQALVTFAPAPRGDAYAGIGPETLSHASSRNEEVARENADGLRAVLREECPLLGNAADSLVAVGREGNVWLVEVCGVPLIGREDAGQAKARRERLVAALADAIDRVMDDGAEPTPAPDAGLRLAASWRDRALASALVKIMDAIPDVAERTDDEGQALDELGEAYQALTADGVPEAAKVSARALAARWLGVAAPPTARPVIDRQIVARALREAGWDAQADDLATSSLISGIAAEIRSQEGRRCSRGDRALLVLLDALAATEAAPAPAERDGWDLLQWRHHAEQTEEQNAFLGREIERVRGILRAALEDQ